MAAKLKPIIVIVGETASGKSALAMELARKLNGEIISADSWAVYRDFDIGTAKPAKSDQAEIHHYLIDVADPKTGFSAAIFKRMATEAIDDIRSSGKLPIMVGGTGLYIDSVIYDYGFLPAPSKVQREKLNNMSLDELIVRAHEFNLDTKDIDTRNKRRVIRLIENKGQLPTKKPLRSDVFIIGLKINRQKLETNIKERVDNMITAGYVDEVQKLGIKYGWTIEPFKAPGYKAFSEYVKGHVSLSEAKQRFVDSDMRLAKKQRTWFKRNKSIHWVGSQIEAVDLATTIIDK